jgi:hypothetical protein
MKQQVYSDVKSTIDLVVYLLMVNYIFHQIQLDSSNDKSGMII